MGFSSPFRSPPADHNLLLRAKEVKDRERDRSGEDTAVTKVWGLLKNAVQKSMCATTIAWFPFLLLWNLWATRIRELLRAIVALVYTQIEKCISLVLIDVGDLWRKDLSAAFQGSQDIDWEDAQMKKSVRLEGPRCRHARSVFRLERRSSCR